MENHCSQFNGLSSYFISLPESSERREALVKSGFAPKLVEKYFRATDLRNYDNAELVHNFVHPKFKTQHGFDMSNAQIGCAISHREVARNILTRAEDLALIFEDDVVPNGENFELHVEEVVKAFQEHARAGASFIVHLGVAPHWHRRVLHRPVKTSNVDCNSLKLFLHSDPAIGLWYAHAYILSKAAAARIAEQEDMLISNVDDWLYRRKIGLIGQIFYTQPLVFKQNDALESLLEADRQGVRTSKAPPHGKKTPKSVRIDKSLRAWLSAITHRILYSFHKIRSIIPYRLPTTEKS